jgi:type II secretory ATPase GspE/PulE/Tfp pilus assembly ATPase PilB-like protein
MASRFGVYWNRCAQDQWADLFAVDLDGPHFDGLEGVYVVWNGGAKPHAVVVGQGRVRDRLKALRENPALEPFKALGLVAAWARVDHSHRDGVLRFLGDALKPNVPGPVLDVPPIEVNLPGRPPLEGAPTASAGPEATLPENKWLGKREPELPVSEGPTPVAKPVAAKPPATGRKGASLQKLFEEMLAERAKAPKKAGFFGAATEKKTKEDDGLVGDAVRLIMQEAMNAGASDVHLEPQESSLRVRFRIDGLLEEVLKIPHTLDIRVVSNIRVSCALDPEKGVGTSKPEDARMTTSVGKQEIDVRLSTFPTPHGDKAVLRLIPRGSTVPRLSELGLRPETVARIGELVRLPQGMIVVTGPTGSGKSTTLYTMLAEINEPHRNIVTLEDPIEKKIPGISQGMLQPKVGFTFSEGLRAILRQDPNVIMVGEVRDTETAEIAMRASLTGHMVLTTLHTNNALGAIARLLDMGLEPYLIGAALTAAFAQRLARRVCPDCAEPAPATDEEKAALAEMAGRDGVPIDVGDAVLKRGRGCAACRETGYRGRVLLFETARVTPAMRQLIMKKAPVDELYALSIREGGETLLMDGWRKAAAGLTTVAELVRVIGSSE